ncbi:prealbumin-like fold domain-containing protein [Kitasatospora sp. P5_F3]
MVKHDQAGKALAGAVFQLWRESNGTPGLQTGGSRADTLAPTPCTTDAQGRCAYQGLLLGSYYFLLQGDRGVEGLSAALGPGQRPPPAHCGERRQAAWPCAADAAATAHDRIAIREQGRRGGGGRRLSIPVLPVRLQPLGHRGAVCGRTHVMVRVVEVEREPGRVTGPRGHGSPAPVRRYDRVSAKTIETAATFPL